MARANRWNDIWKEHQNQQHNINTSLCQLIIPIESPQWLHRRFTISNIMLWMLRMTNFKSFITIIWQRCKFSRLTISAGATHHKRAHKRGECRAALPPHFKLLSVTHSYNVCCMQWVELCLLFHYFLWEDGTNKNSRGIKFCTFKALKNLQFAFEHMHIANGNHSL